MSRLAIWITNLKNSNNISKHIIVYVDFKKKFKILFTKTYCITIHVHIIIMSPFAVLAGTSS